MEKPKKNPNQVTGNAGLFYASYQLAVRGWNVLPTSRNSKGPDIFIYSQDGKKMYKVQVKALSKLSPVNPGSMDSWLMNDFVIKPIYNTYGCEVSTNDIPKEHRRHLNKLNLGRI